MKLSDTFKSATFGIGAIAIPAALVCAPIIGALVDGETTLGQHGAFTQVIATVAAAMAGIGLAAYSPKKAIFAAAALVTTAAIGYGVYEGTLNPVHIAQKLGAPASLTAR